MLFHARVHEEFQLPGQAATLRATGSQKRLAALGSLEFDEIRNVLRQERFLLPPYDDPSTYVEFAAVYLGIRYFHPYLMASFFPALESLEKVDAVIARDIHAEEILAATRLPGTPEPEELREAARQAAEAFDADSLGMVADRAEEPHPRERAARWARGRQRSEQKYLLWSQRAQRQAAATWRGPGARLRANCSRCRSRWLIASHLVSAAICRAACQSWNAALRWSRTTSYCPSPSG